MPKENDLEGPQDPGGKHGGQKGMPRSETFSSRNPKKDADEPPSPKPSDGARSASESQSGPKMVVADIL